MGQMKERKEKLNIDGKKKKVIVNLMSMEINRRVKNVSQYAK